MVSATTDGLLVTDLGGDAIYHYHLRTACWSATGSWRRRWGPARGTYDGSVTAGWSPPS